MDESMYKTIENTRKRKAIKEASLGVDELNQDMLEKVLSWLPTSSFFRLNSVCKRWRSLTSSPTFRIACSQVPSRDPWFLMVGHNLDQSTVFDCSEHNWKSLNCRKDLKNVLDCNSVPVASAGGLVCYRRSSGLLFVVNPVTGEFRELPRLPVENEPLHAIAMCCSEKNYRIVLVGGEFPKLNYIAFDSSKCAWEDEVVLNQKDDNSAESRVLEDETLYFLSKTGDVVATNMQRSPCKQYSSVLTIENGEQIVYFLSQSGNVVACNLVRKTFFELPRLLPVYCEYSIDIVECNGQMLVVVLSELLETASLRVWKLSEDERSWEQVAAMPPSMSHEFYGKKVDVNCSGSGNKMFICVNSSEINRCLMFDMASKLWVELPEFVVDGNAKEFMSAFSVEPRLESNV